MLDAYHVFYQKVPLEGGDYAMDHTASFYFFDNGAELMGFIGYTEDYDTAIDRLRSMIASSG